MAKKTTDYDINISGLDDFDFDDFDMGDDFSTGNKKDDRKPVTKFASSFAEGARDSFKQPSFYKNILRKALPREYGDALDDFDSVVDKTADLYNKTSRKMEPMAKDLRKIAKAFLPMDSKYLPDSFKEWANEKELEKISEAAQRENNLNLELNTLFKASMVQSEREKEENRLREASKLITQRKIHGQQISVLESIREGISRQVGYQDSINARFQRKSLELQYRHFYVAKDTLEAIKVHSNKTMEALQAVIKNTGLPDAVKLHSKEAIGVNLRERFINKFTDPAVRGLNSLVDRLSKNLGAYVEEQVDFLKDGVEMAAMGAEMMSEMGMDKTQMAGSLVGSAITGKLGELLGEKFKNKFSDKSGKIKAGGLKLNKFRRNAGSRFFDWVEGATEGRGVKKDKYGREIKGSRSGLANMFGDRGDDDYNGYKDMDDLKSSWFKDFLFDMVGSRKDDGLVAKSFIEHSQDPVAFNALARRSLVEIIPGYLSRILKEITVLRTGDEEADTVVYDIHRGTFSKMKAKRMDMRDRIRRTSGTSYTATDLADLIKTIDPEGKLSPQAAAALRVELLRRSRDGKEFDPSVMAQDANYHASVSGSDRAELSKHFKEKYQTDRARKLGEGLEIDEAIDKADNLYLRLNDRFADLVAEVQRQIENGHTEDLESMGLVRIDSEGKVYLNTDGIFDLILSEDAVLKAAETKQAQEKAKFVYRGQRDSFKMHSEFKKIQAKNPVDGLNIGQIGNKAKARMGGLKDAAMGAGQNIFGRLSGYVGGSLGLGGNLGGVLSDLFGKAKGHVSKAYQDVKAQIDPEAVRAKIDTAVKTDNVGKIKEAIADIVGSDAAEKVFNSASAEASASANRSNGSGGSFREELTSILTNQLNAQLNMSEALLALNQQLMDGIQVNHIHESGKRKMGLRQGIRSMLGGAAAGTGSVMRWSGKLWGQMIRGSGSVIGAGLQLGASALGWAARKIGGFGRYSSVFRQDQRDKPLLVGNLMKAGVYVDSSTNKVVKSIKDITGPVVNSKTGLEVLTKEDFDVGLVDEMGKPILREVARKLLDFYSAAYSPFGALANLATTGISSITKAFLKSPDVYVAGDPSIRLHARIMANGGYKSATSGKIIRSFSDIDGPVLDASGTEVIKASELSMLVDRRGKKLRTLADRFVDGAKTILGAGLVVGKHALNAGKGIVNFTVGVMKRMWRFVKRGLGFKGTPKTPQEAELMVSSQQLEILMQIRDIIDERLGRKKIFGDNDGDGDRENSWQDKMARRKQQAEDAAKKAAEKGSDIFSKMGDSLKGIFGGLLGGGGEESGGDGDTIIGGSADLGGDGGDEKDKKGKQKPKGKWGKVKAGAGAALDWGKKWGSKLAPWLMRGAAVAATAAGIGSAAGLTWGGVAAGVGGALATVAGGIASFLASPVVLIGLGVAAVGVGAYYGYKYLTRGNNGDLAEYRLLQYGVHPKESDRAKKIFSIETILLDHVRFSQDKAYLNLTKEVLAQIMMEFGVASDDPENYEQFIAWFDGRFKPVYLNSISALRMINKTTELANIDNDFKSEEIIQFMQGVTFDYGSGPYTVFANPFTEGSLTVETHEIKDQHAKIIAKHSSKADDKKGSVPGSDLKSSSKPNANVNVSSSPMTSTTSADGWQKYKPNPESGLAAAGTSKTIVANVLGLSGKEGTILPLEIVRMKTYGLVDLEKDKVRVLKEMEAGMLLEILVSPEGEVKFKSPTATFFDKYGASFGVSGSNVAGKQQWYRWFEERFVPTFITFVSAVKKLSSTTNIETASTFLKLEYQIQVAGAVIGAKGSGLIFKTSVWNIKDSPWPGYTLNSDSESTRVNIEAMRNMAKQSSYVDKVGGAKKPPTPDAANKSVFDVFDRTKPDPIKPPPTPNQTEKISTNPNAEKTIEKIDVAGGLRKGMSTKEAKGLPSGYMMPAEGTITSLFGMRRNGSTGAMEGHKGLDIGAPRGTPVIAAQSGTITKHYTSSSYGNVIFIKHDDGRETRYAHLNHFQPGYGVGSYVNQGAIIGYVGNTGRSRGDHLHFEIRENGTPIDPLNAIKSDPLAKDAVKEVERTKEEAKKKEDTEGLEMEGENTIASTVSKTDSVSTKSLVATKEPAGIADALKTVTNNANANNSVAPSTTRSGLYSAPSAEDMYKERSRNVGVVEARQQDQSKRLSGSVDSLSGLMNEQVRLSALIANNTKDTVELLRSINGKVGKSTDSQAVTEKEPVAKQTTMSNRPVAREVTNGPVSVKKVRS